MITGFNTDVQHGGVTYHVQTEDKGLDSPLILSLVYVGGAIIASKRTPYEVGQSFDEQALTERLQRQHKLIIAAIKAGRVEDLKRMGGPNGAQGQEAEPQPDAAAAPPAGKKAGGQRRKKTEAAAPPVEAPPPAAESTPPPAKAEPEVAGQETASPAADVLFTPPSEAPAAETTKAPPSTAKAPASKTPEASPSRPAAEDAPILVEPLPVEAAASDAHAPVKTEPEIVILTTLADEISALGDLTPPLYQRPPAPPKTEPPAAAPAEAPRPRPRPQAPAPQPPPPAAVQPEDTDEIYMTLLDDEGEFRAGQLATIKVYVGRGAFGHRPEADASVMVKVLGTSFRPLILTATTDNLGVGVVRALLPRFTSGRAAIIIRATKGDEAAEMRRIIHQ